MRALSFPALAIGLLLGAHGAAGQTASNPPASEGSAKSGPKVTPTATTKSSTKRVERARVLRDDQRHAVGLVDKIAGEARLVDDLAARIRLEARAADLMWDFDEARARAVFRRAFDEAEGMRDDTGSTLFGGPLRARLLAEVVRRAYVRDAALADRFLDALDDTDDGVDYGFPIAVEPTEQGSARLAVAASIASSDSTAAAALARGVLDEVAPGELNTFLLVLRRFDRSAADAVYGEAVTRLAVDASGLADMLPLQSYAIPTLEPGASDPWQSFGARQSSELAARYLEAVWAVGQRQYASDAGWPDAAEAARLYAVFASLLPSYDQYDPARVPDVRALLARFAASLEPAERDRFDALARAETPQSLVARAEATSDPSLRESLFYRAASLAAASSDDFAEVASYAGRLGNAEVRRTFLDGAGLMIVRRLSNVRRFDDALRVARAVPGIDARVRSHLAIAERAAEVGDRPRAVEVLDAAEAAAVRADTHEQAYPLALVATAYARVDVLRSAEVMQNAVRAVNTVARAARAATDTSRGGREPASGSAGTPACSELEPGLERIAAQDYFRALLLAQSIDDKACSMSAQLAAARGALSRLPRRVVRKPGS